MLYTLGHMKFYTKAKKYKYIFIAIIIILIIGLGWLIFGRSEVRDTNTNTAQSGAMTDEKNAIIAAILNQQKIMLSKDPAQIKAYFTKLAVTSDDKKEMSRLTNADLLKMAQATAPAGVISTSTLTATNAIWNTSPDIAVIRIPYQGKTVGFTVQKVNDVWY